MAAIATPKHYGSADRPVTPARWTTANKDAIGCAIAETSRVWFSAARGVLTEVFYPAPDQACLRLLELVVTDGPGFVSEEGSATQSTASVPHEFAPVAGVLNSCDVGRYQIEKETIADPCSDVILQRIRFRALEHGHYRVFCVLEPHLGNCGDDNIAVVGQHKGVPMLFGHRDDGLAVALACSAPLLAATAGFVGNDGRTQLRTHGHLVSRMERAGAGNISVTGEIDVGACGGDFVIALGFGRTMDEAAHLALGSLHRGYASARETFVEEWEHWHAALRRCPVDGEPPALWTRSATILKTLEAKRPNGGRVAALATPWGASRGPGIDGTYHLIWTRDLVESVGALLAAGAHHEVGRALEYLRSTQEPDGHWPQNMHLSGTACWNHNELDEVALPLVFLHLAERDGLLSGDDLRRHWPMVQRAAGWLVRHGPTTTRDRWEDTAGITPFTIGAAIVALLVASELAELCGESSAARLFVDVADQWNDSIERWLFRRGGALADAVGVAGYYVRARQPGADFAGDLELDQLPPTEVSPDALALVRFGLRAPDDPRIVDTVRVIDATLQSDFDAGPAWRRYPHDHYGEHADGAPFDGDDHGIGRPWPLLAGERAHYELALGHRDRALALLRGIESFANASGCLPEQVWDAPDIRERDLVRGKPSGSAAPLGWTHGEYVKLCRSLADGRVFDLPAHAVERYVQTRAPVRVTMWRPGDPIEPIQGTLRIACFAPARIDWTRDAWATTEHTLTRDTGVGLHIVDLPDGPLRVRINHLEPRDGDGSELTFSNKEQDT